MLDVIDQIQELNQKGTPFALCTVIGTWRSSPRPVGSALVVTEDGQMYGSVSGGCVENAVVAKALSVLESGQSEIANFGVADEEAWELGLSCGGAIEILITPSFDPVIWTFMTERMKENKGVVVVRSLPEGLSTAQDMDAESVGKPLQPEVKAMAYDYLFKARSGQDGDGKFFIHSFPSKPKMILIGSAHISVELIELASMYDFETIVIDPRDTFAKKTGYKVQPDRLLVNWPQEVLNDFDLDLNTYIVILSHDPKIDDEALKIVLDRPVRYIGALGSKKTHAKRVARLTGYGFVQDSIERIKAPIGLDIGSHTAKEIALSIMGEVIKEKNH